MSTIKEYLEEIQGRPVAVIGMGVSNTPLIKMLLRAGAEVTVRDRVPRERAAEQVQELESLGARMILGEEYLQDLHEDVIFRTPGLSPNTPELVNAVQRGIELSSEMELFFQTCPSRVIGVTGSDGKTTTTTIIAEFLKEAGKNVYVGGNIGRPLLADVADMVEEDYAVLELSSFQLMTMDQSPHIAVVTNISPNHLDYHHTMENYFQAKAKLFEQMAQDTRSRRKPVAVINIDDAYGRRLAEMFSGRMTVKTYGSALGADFRMLVHHATAKGSEYELEYKGKSYLVRVPLIGKFNMYNSLAALAAVICAGIPVRDAIANLQNIPQVPGRLELFTHPGGAQIFIDYAHTPDALENVCKTLKELCSRRLITVFGCGGDRDRGKRPLMGAAAARLSDACIVTSDNPRSEEPLSIISQIAAGMPEGRYAIIPDRARAIATAIEQARLGDIVLIAGKGHENYQELSTGRIDFSDAKEVRRNMFIKEREEFPQA